MFGPVMLVWFIIVGLLGLVGIVQVARRARGAEPLPAITYLWRAGPLAFVVIGGAFLAVTGGEAFYAEWDISARCRSARPGSASRCPR